VGPYIPYGLFQTTGETCAKFGSNRFRNVDLYKVQTYIQTSFFIYKISSLRVKNDSKAETEVTQWLIIQDMDF